jgi:hypothetical protein
VVLSFFKLLAEERLTPGFFTDHFLQNKVLICLNYFKILFFWHQYIFGLIHHYLPYILPSQVFKVLKIDIEYKASDITYAAAFFYCWKFGCSDSTSALIFSYTVLLSFTSGYVAMYYWTETV